ncbi:hypothetical protein D3C86_1796590 [compost metagenome]
MVIRFCEPTVHTVLDQFIMTAILACYDRQPARHGFHDIHREPFAQAGGDSDIAHRQQSANVFAVTEEIYPILDPKLRS